MAVVYEAHPSTHLQANSNLTISGLTALIRITSCQKNAIYLEFPVCVTDDESNHDAGMKRPPFYKMQPAKSHKSLHAVVNDHFSSVSFEFLDLKEVQY